MPKILTIALISTFPLTIGLNQVNVTLKTNNLLKSYWLEPNKTESLILNSDNLNKNKNYIYSNNQIDISLIKNEISQTIAQIYAKKPQKSYYLSLKNDYLYDNDLLTNFIKNKFYRDKIKQRFISSNDFFLLLDANKNGSDGKIIKNNHVHFRSSWGVSNGSSAESEFQYKIKSDTIKNHLGLLKNNNFVIKSFRPKKIGILPTAAIYKVPIQNASYQVTQFEIDNYFKFYDLPNEIKLDLPEGHTAGTEWWKGITSFLGIAGGAILTMGIAAIAAIISGGTIIPAMTLAFATWVAKGGLGIALITSFLMNHFLWNKIDQWKLKQRNKEAKKIYNLIMQNSTYLNVNPIYFNNNHDSINLKIKGKLHANANATSVWGASSEIGIYDNYVALSGDVEVEEYAF